MPGGSIDRIEMMRGKPFLESAKDDERESLLRRLAIALSPKPYGDKNSTSEQSSGPKSTRQE
jgi:hypothetical protein